MSRLQVSHLTFGLLPLLSVGSGGVAAAGDVGARILRWVLDNVQESAVWLVKGGYRALAEGGSLLLIVSGLSILAIVVPVMLLQGAVTEKAYPPPTVEREPAQRRLSRFQKHKVRSLMRGREEAVHIRHDPSEVKRGRDLAGTLDGLLAVDDVLDAMAERRMGEPWIVAFSEDTTLIRMYDCEGCAPAANAHGCGFETGFLHGAFQKVYPEADIVVREIACHGFGHASCEYEVRH